jgi:cytochrome c-type biogenesis protein CcmH
MKRIILFLLLAVLALAAQAIDSLQFSNPEQQAAYESLTSELRCLVCQNQTIADSNADLAADLRRQVYEMLQQGKSKQAILQFMTERYGDFVLYKPPFKAKTGLLWLGPVAFLLAGLLAVFLVVRGKRRAEEEKMLQPEKLDKIRSLLLEESGPDEGDSH